MTSPAECLHPKQMLINNVRYCLTCATYLYSGLCPKCGRAFDDHFENFTRCPKDGDFD
jgi:predicted amidophosphoribosyltransferase